MVKKFRLGNVDKELYIYPLIVTVFSLFQIRLLYSYHQFWLKPCHLTTFNIFTGHPYIRSFQNRFLGPIIINCISYFGLSPEKSIAVFYYILFCGQNLLMFYILRKVLIRPENALKQTFFFIGLYTLCMHHLFYPWDIIELVMFTLLMYGIIKGKSLIYFTIIFIISLLNKESAVFIAVWLIIDSFSIERRIRLSSLRKLIFGALGLIIGIAYTKFVRDYFFISSWSDEIGMDNQHQFFGNYITIYTNLKNLVELNINPLIFIPKFFFLSIIFFYIYNIKRYTPETIKLVILGSFILLSITFLAYFTETRVFCIMVPIILFTNLFFQNSIKDQGF